jgi:hypothetical protein
MACPIAECFICVQTPDWELKVRQETQGADLKAAIFLVNPGLSVRIFLTDKPLQANPNFLFKNTSLIIQAGVAG